MANSEPEILRLLDLLPASARMTVKIVGRSDRPQVLAADFPLPWQRDRPIYINFELWRRIPRPQRDLLMLRQSCWLMGVRWFEPSWYQGALLLGAASAAWQISQGDALGAVASGGLTGLAGWQIWRNNQRNERELEVDRDAIGVAARRGYSESEAARLLLEGIETVAQLERRPGLDFLELLRCQRLRAIAGLSPLGATHEL
jgi:hypothetical protein